MKTDQSQMAGVVNLKVDLKKTTATIHVLRNFTRRHSVNNFYTST